MNKEEVIETLIEILEFQKFSSYLDTNRKQLNAINTAINLIDTLQADKNKLINYIAVREDKTHEEVCKEFEV